MFSFIFLHTLRDFFLNFFGFDSTYFAEAEQTDKTKTQLTLNGNLNWPFKRDQKELKTE